MTLSEGDRVLVRHLMSHTSEGTPGQRYQYNSACYCQLSQVAQTVQEKLAFIDSLNGHLAALSVNYTVEGRTMTVDIHVPSGNFGEAMTILMTQLGNVTYTNASAVDVSKRYAKLHAELMRLQRIAQGLSGAAWAEAQHTIKNLRRMMAFRLERSAFAIIILHVRESQEDSP